jgi:hypothetical protein
MARKQQNPDEIVHVQVNEGETVLTGHQYGSRATLQVRRGDLDRVRVWFALLSRSPRMGGSA